MQVYEDIWITLTRDDLLAQVEGEAGGADGLEEALAAFHQARQAKAAFEIIGPETNPLPLTEEGAVVVAATLGPVMDRLPEGKWLKACLKAGLFQLEAYLNYRVSRFVSPLGLFIGHPAVPGGAIAPDLRPETALLLLPDNPTGIEVREEKLWPPSSLLFLYPLTSRSEKQASPCSACNKDCSLRQG